MSNDPTTNPTGEAEMAKTARNRSARAGQHPGMMGDGTEEQNLGQPGDPSARISEGEVKDAFTRTSSEARSFAEDLQGDVAERVEDARERVADKMQGAGERLSALGQRINAMRGQAVGQVQQSAGVAKDWAMKQADAAKQATSDKPVLVLSVSAGAALAVGLLAGFVIGRATADEY